MGRRAILRSVLVVVGICLITTLMTGVAAARSRSADLVFTNGFVYTVDDRQPVAQAVAVRDGKILFVGSSRCASQFIGRDTKVVDLKGRMLMPSFIDSHAHASDGVNFVHAVTLFDQSSVAGYLGAIKKFAGENPDLSVIRGEGWDPSLFGAEGPSKTDLDQIDSRRPLAFLDTGAHSLWVNSATLKLAGITGSTPDPEGGKIQRIPNSVSKENPYGIPSGTIRELAMQLVAAVLPDFTAQQYTDGLVWFEQSVAAPLGITTVFDPSVPVDSPALAAYEGLAKAGMLSMRVRAGLQLLPDDDLATWLRHARADRARQTTPLFKITAAKFYADGVIDGHTAYLKQPYADQPGYRGDPLWQPGAMNRAFAAVDRAGFQIHVHSIGDAATAETLDALQYVRRVNGHFAPRPGIAHLSYMDPSDICRLARLRAVAQIQPYWAVKDAYYAASVAALGQWRADHQYPFRSLFNSGALVASSSDWSTTPVPNPLVAIQSGVMRWFPGISLVDQPLWPQQSVSVQQMIRSFTINGARANFLEWQTGSITRGKSADMIVLDTNIVKCPPDQIGSASVLMTMLQGQEIYHSDAF